MNKTITIDISPERYKKIEESWIQYFKDNPPKPLVEILFENHFESFVRKIVEKWNGGVNPYVPFLLKKHELENGDLLIFYQSVELGIIKIHIVEGKLLLSFHWSSRLHHIFNGWEID